MNELDTVPAPSVPSPPLNKWRREQSSFRSLLPTLLATHRGLFVAIHNGSVVESGPNKLDVAAKAYARFGYVPIYVSLDTESPAMVVRIPSPRFSQPVPP